MALQFPPVLDVRFESMAPRADRKQTCETMFPLAGGLPCSGLSVERVLKLDQSSTCVDPRPEFIRMERFSYIIVCPRAQAGGDVGRTVSGGKNDQVWLLYALRFPDCAADLRSAHFRHYPVQNGYRGSLRTSQGCTRL